MTYVTDTHPLLWYLAADERLSKRAALAFDEAETGDGVIVVPSIVLAETIRVIEKKRLMLKFEDVLRAIGSSSNYQVLPLDFRLVLELTRVPGLTELHDRIIVGSARLLGAPLITADSEISRSGCVPVIW